MTTRVMRRAEAGDQGKCRCGLRRAYIVDITMKRPNSHGLLVDVTVLRSLCTTHGRVYAAKWKLGVREAHEDATHTDRGR